MEQAAAAVGADGASAAVAVAAADVAGVGGTVVHAADFDVRPADDDTGPDVVDGIGPGIAAGVLVAGIAAAVALAAETAAAAALAVDAVPNSDRFVRAPAPASLALPSLASPSQSEIILTFQLNITAEFQSLCLRLKEFVQS